MATNPLHVNKESTRVEMPGVVINGKQINSDGLIIAQEDWRPSRNDIEELGGNFTNLAERVYYADGNDYPTITLEPDAKFTAKSYYATAESAQYDGAQVGALKFQGAKEVDGNALGLESETYYTLNGKNPKRTKSNLYTVPFIIRRNTSGSDNTILKARTYRAGQWSEIRMVEIRVARKVDTKV
jgi:hypothetical protein